MRLANVVIPDAKLYDYLLAWRPVDDKSKMLALLGYTLDNAEELRRAITLIVLTNEANLTEENRYGKKSAVHGELVGPLGRRQMLTIWIERKESIGLYSFVTLVPND